MKILYGFAHIGHLVDNTPDVVGPVGELSSYSMTFAQDKLIYSNVDKPNLTFINFFYQDDVQVQTLTNAEQVLIIEACDWVFQQARFGNFSESIAEFQTKFLTEFGGRLEIISSGTMVNFGNNKNCPESIVICPPGDSTTVAWNIWLSDSAFRNQCPVSKILTVTPILELDDFFTDAASVTGMVVPPAIQRMNDEAESKKGDYPHTALRTWMFNWVDPNNEDNRIPTYWLTIHYGDAGNNLDQAKESIRDHVLSNSSRNREEWAKIFPDLFTSTEFIIVPHYKFIAVPSKTRQSAIYSPTSNYTEVLEDANRLVKGTGYNEAHIKKVLETTSSLYRSLTISFVGGPENRDKIDTLSKRYSDYINVPTTHVDFGYMEEETREFVMILNELLSIAESATSSSSIPRRFNRIVRDDQVYIGISFENFLYLVVPKYAYQ